MMENLSLCYSVVHDGKTFPYAILSFLMKKNFPYAILSFLWGYSIYRMSLAGRI